MRFAVVGIFAIFLLFSVLEAKQQKNKPWMKSPSSGVHRHNGSLSLIGRKFTKRALMQFLKKRPKLWKPRTITHSQRLKYRKQMGGMRPTKKHEEQMNRVRKMQAKNRRSKNMHHRQDYSLPYEFDAREHWPNCESIRIIQDQSNCGSCWAVSTASAMSDRACILTNGERQPQLSATDLLSCCSECQTVENNGCRAGYANLAWAHIRKSGVTTGGKYGSGVGCRSYPFPPRNVPMQDGDNAPPQCTASCENGNDYESSKHYGTENTYPGSVEEIQRELYNNGPLTVYLKVYEDLYTYKTGVYYHDHGNEMGAHFVRLIGWGEENGVPYWLIANSWGEEWGERGTGKIVRGANHVDIERFPMAAGYDYGRSASN